MAETFAERARRRRTEKCVHFTGIQNNTCKAGHSYASLNKPLPCIAPFDGGERGCCVDLRLPTPEEIKARDQRHACAEAAIRNVPDNVAAETHEAVMNTPFPGERTT